MSETADLILSKGLVRSFDPAHRLAEAVAVRGGKILALGTNTDIMAYRGANTQLIDLKGRTLLPGFIDAHQHQLYMGLSFGQVDARAETVSGIAEIIEQFGARAAGLPPGTWIEGRGYHDARLAENRDPTRYDLDLVTADHPAFLTRVCGHVMVVNSRALQLANITSATPDPPGGTIDRDPVTGEPTGVLRETAMRLLRRVVPQPNDAMLKTAILDGAAHNLSKGITSVWEPSIEPDHLRVYQALDAAGELPVRVTMAHKKVLRSGEEVPLPQRFTGAWLSLVAVKLFQDGGFGGATAALTEPYANAPETRGLLTWLQEEINERAREIHEAGLRISIHAIGDAAIISVLDAIEYALDGATRTDHRHRIEHCGLPIPPIPQRIKALGVVPVLQPPFLWFDGDVYMDRVGPERSHWLYPARTLLDAGLPIAGSSDGPVVPDVSPLLGIFVAATRRSRAGRIVTAEEALNLEDAFSLYTSRAAYACGEERLKGTITPGKLADFVVLTEDPFKVDLNDLPEIPIEMTIVNGLIT